MGSKKVKAPPPRDYKQEMLDALNAQAGIQGQLLDFERQWTPEYLRLQEMGIGGGVDTMGRLLGQAQGVSSGLQGQFLGMQAPLYGQVGQAAMGAYKQSLDSGTLGLYDSLMASARNDLSAGRGLTPEMEKLATQSARQAMAARGLSGNQAVAQEVLNSYQLGEARENRARQFAGSMYNAGIGQTQAANAMYGQPLMTQMAGYSPASLVQGGSGLYSSMGPQLFQPESQYNASLISSNRQEQMQAQMANAQSRAGLVGGLLKMGGAILGGPAGMSLFGASTAASGLQSGISKAGQMGSGPNFIDGNDMAY